MSISAPEITLDKEPTSLPVEKIVITLEESLFFYPYVKENTAGLLRKRTEIFERELAPLPRLEITDFLQKEWSFDIEKTPHIEERIECVKIEGQEPAAAEEKATLELLNFFNSSILLFRNSSGQIYKFAIFPIYLTAVDIKLYRGFLFIVCWDCEEDNELETYIFDTSTDSFIQIEDLKSRRVWASMAIDETTDPHTLVLYSYHDKISRIGDVKFYRIFTDRGILVHPEVDEILTAEFYGKKGCNHICIDNNANVWLKRSELFFGGHVYLLRPDLTLATETSFDAAAKFLLEGFMLKGPDGGIYVKYNSCNEEAYRMEITSVVDPDGGSQKC